MLNCLSAGEADCFPWDADSVPRRNQFRNHPKLAVITLAISLFILLPNEFCTLAHTVDSSPLASSTEDSPAPPEEGPYEELPELKASEILKPEYVKGPHYSVRESVQTGSGVNQFVIDSDFGVF